MRLCFIHKVKRKNFSKCEFDSDTVHHISNKK
jgi:hypothetical protein